MRRPFLAQTKPEVLLPVCVHLLLADIQATFGTIESVRALYLDNALFPVYAEEMRQNAPQVANPFMISLATRDIPILPISEWKTETAHDDERPTPTAL